MNAEGPSGEERAASARRFAALRSLGRQDHLGEVQRALQASITALEEHEREIPFALALLLDAAGQAHLVATYGVDVAAVPRGQFLLADVPWLHVSNDRSIVELAGVSASSGSAGQTPRAFVARISSGSQPGPFAILALGVDDSQATDADYLTFIELVAERIGRSARLASEREARSRAVGLLDALPALISVTRGPDHVYEFVNRAYAAATGLERQTLGRSFQQAYSNDQLDDLGRARDRALQGETVVLAETPMVTRADETEPSYFDLVYQPLYGPGGRVDGVLSFAIDVSEQVRARKRVEALAEELEQATRFKDELLALVSHELRTPLTIALGTLELLAREVDTLSREDIRSLLGDALQNGRRLERLVNNMLGLSRAELLGAADIDPLLLHRVLPAMVARLARDLRFDPERIDLDLAPLRPALASQVFLEQIVANLIGNGFKYGAPDGVVSVSLKDAGERAAIVVENRGDSLDPLAIKTIFEPFVRIPGSEMSASGLGLGLAVCRRLAAAQSGDMTAEPREGGGLRVTLFLPFADHIDGD